ncbi:MAG: HAD hydrolase family protein [Burkholderiales bacterium]|nr:HAD hydrolase family protein [Burkholderiales bacterium]MDE2457284.1 HAD hydrolase family protein [Burkholderiales bacterium]
MSRGAENRTVRRDASRQGRAGKAGASRDPVVLATDLDGTFLGGSEGQREQLHRWLEEHRSEVVLVFVSGRGQDFMRELARTLPVAPDHCIGDVGTSVCRGGSFETLPELETWLDGCWPQDAPARIEDAMRAHPRLRLQEGCGGRRRSYCFDDEADAVAAARDVQALGFDTLVSDNLYFDVLPRGVCKGPTLLRTLEALGLPAHRTLVAGDTLNDLSMFQTGLAGVVVANREPALDAALGPAGNVYRSPLPGAQGVLDALRRFHQLGRTHEVILGHRLSQAAV